MFENILTKKSVSFKDLEQICFKIACEFAKELLKSMLKEYDNQLMDKRDKKQYRNKGFKGTTIKTVVGEVGYDRRMYIDKETNKSIFLMDEQLGIKGIGDVSENVIELIVDTIKELSYRACATTVSNATGISISSVAIWNIIQSLGKQIKENEEHKVKAYEEGMLEEGTKEIEVLYQEADGVMIYTQGKDRKEQYDKYKKEHPNEEVPKKTRNVEIKLGMTYEGWKKVGKNRYELVGKEYVVGYMTGEKMAQITNANLYNKYKMDKVKIRALNSDGGSWIQKLKTEKTIVQADPYHFQEKISACIEDEEDVKKMKQLYYKRQYREMMKFINELKYKCGGECEQIKKLEALEKYCTKRKTQMKRYNEDEKIKLKLSELSKKTGLKYRNMGCQESNNYSILTRRMKHKRMIWSKEGSENIAKVIVVRASESTKNMICKYSFKQLPKEFRNYAEKYVQEIENNIKLLKKRREKVRGVYDFKTGTLLGNSKLKEIINIKPISELIYR